MQRIGQKLPSKGLCRFFYDLWNAYKDTYSKINL